MLDFWEESTQTEEKKMPSEKYSRQAKYDANNTKMFGLKLNLNTDKDVIEKLDTVKNKQGYIKSLIRADLEGTDDSISNGDAIACLRAIKRALEGLDL